MIKNINKKLFLFLIIFITVFSLFSFVFAQVNINVEQAAVSGGLSNIDTQTLFSNIIKWVLGILGAILLVIIILAGFKWMTSGGDATKIEKAKKLLVNAVIGFAIILASYIIVSFITKSIGLGLNGENPTPNSSICNAGDCVSCNRVCNESGTGIVETTGCDINCSDKEFKFLVTDYGPKNNNVNLCSMIWVKFNAEVFETEINNNFKLYKCNNNDCSILANRENITSQGAFEFNSTGDDNTIFTFKLNNDYNVNQKYFVTLGSIKDTDNNPLFSNSDWSFQTGATLDNSLPEVKEVFPSNATDNVCTRTHISVTFTKEMDPISLLTASSTKIYKNNNTSPDTSLTFKHYVSDSNTKLILKASDDYAVNSTYKPLLDATVIKDTCGNFLNTNNNSVGGEQGVDNYPSKGPSDSWYFQTGLNAECKPKITSVNPAITYYDADNAVEIIGEYLNNAKLVFNDQVEITDSSQVCMNNEHWFGKSCKSDDWTGESIKFFVPVIGGGSSGARSGNIKVVNPDGSDSKDFDIMSPRIDDISPSSGSKGQFISISGFNFGEYIENTSEIYFRSISSGDLINADLPCGSVGWNANDIILAVPEDIQLGDYYIQIKTKQGNVERWSNLFKQFSVTNEEVGPGLCSIFPSGLKYQDHFTINGLRFGDNSYTTRAVVFGNINNLVTSTVVSFSGGDATTQDKSVEAITPNLASGRVGVRIFTEKNGIKKFSNFLSPTIQVESSNNFKISYISPSSTTIGGYVTIYGSGFGNLRENGRVVFENGDIVGSFDFPAACSSNYWKDNQIIVKVPDFPNLNSNYLTNIRVEKGSSATNEVPFTVKIGSPAPSICSVNPIKGTLGTEITVNGEYFRNPTVDNAKFSIGDQNNVTKEIDDITNNSLVVKVPNTKTGPFALHNSTGYGNSWNFEYVATSTPPSPNFDFYGWHFSTCVECKIPRVRMQSCSSTFYSSPSPFPGSRDVSQNPNIYLEFEYLNGENASMSASSLMASKYTLINCGANHNCGSNTVTLSTTSPMINSSITLTTPTLTKGNWYRLFLDKNNIKDFENNQLLQNYEFDFQVSATGESCIADSLKINPTNNSIPYQANRHLPYTVQPWDSEGCYLCDSEGYNYSWTKNSNIIDLLPTNTSSTEAIINSDNSLGTVNISALATSSTISLSASTTLTIIGNCSSSINIEPNIENRQVKCLDQQNTIHPNFECCWDGFNNLCVNSGNSICERPFVLLKQCRPAPFGGNPQLASPSPVASSSNVVIDSIIHAEFAKSGSNVSMKENTYLTSKSVSIKECGIDASPDKCIDVSVDDLKLANTSNSSMVDYSNFNFLPNTWYSITLNNYITDNAGKQLIPQTWKFKTGTNICKTENISVLPNVYTMGVGAKKRYSAVCYDNNCNVCDSSKYSFAWQSSTSSIASIAFDANFSSIATATALINGFTNIHATNTNLSISNFGRLNVGTNNQNNCLNKPQSQCIGNCCWNNNTCSPCDSITPTEAEDFVLEDYFPFGQNECPNTQISADFMSFVDASTLTNNVKILDSSGNSIPFNVYSYMSDTTTSSRIVLNVNTMLATSTNYKIQLSDRIKSIYGKPLSCSTINQINFNKTKICISNECNDDRDCSNEDFCVGGKCLKRCEKEVECNSGATCVPYNSAINPGYCKNVCNSASDCDNNQMCVYEHPSTEVNVEDADSHFCSWGFKTGASICQLDHVVIIQPTKHYYQYTQEDYPKSFFAESRTSLGKPIVPIPNVYDWTFNWQSLDESLIVKTFSDNDGNAIFTSQNKNGKTKAVVTVNKLDSAVGYNGAPLSDSANVELFMCNSPWTFTDDAYDFRLQYCEDGGLPVLSNPPTSVKIFNPPLSDGLMKEYIFMYPDNQFAMNPSIEEVKSGDNLFKQIGVVGLSDNRLGFRLISDLFSNVFSQLFHKVLAAAGSYKEDVIGLRIYENKKHLSPLDWYNSSGVVNFKGNPQSKMIDSYSGIQDGTTVYVNAANINSANSANSIIYTNIYLISRNENASPQTTDIFNQLVDNWRFNNNNSNIKENLVKDTIRWQDLRSMELKLDNYANNNKYCTKSVNSQTVISNTKCNTTAPDCTGLGNCVATYPVLNAGTYVNGQSNSLWPSWNTTLGNQIGASLPIDPDNYFGNCTSNCPNCNKETCWDDIAHKFYCPKNSKIYSYSINNSTLPTSYTLLGSFEYSNNTSWGGINSALNPTNIIGINNESICNE